MSKPKTPVRQRLLNGYVEMEGKLSTPCWVWTGYCIDHWFNYGQMNIDGRIKRVHRVSYETFVTPIPLGQCVLHKCDNPPCYNPEHLFLGTKADNTADMFAKGRDASGELKGNSKLTVEQVHEIRKLLNEPISQLEIAEQYDVHPSSISYIKSGRYWRRF